MKRPPFALPARLLVFALACTWLLAAGCATSSSQGSAEPAPAAEPAADPPASAHGPRSDGAGQKGPPAQADRLFRGVIKETMDSGGYTYMNVEMATGERRWTAADQTEVEPGDRVTLRISMHLSDFRSKTLERTFRSIYFVYVEQVDRAAAPYEGTI